MSEVRIVLQKPITAHGAEVTELVLRKPVPEVARNIGSLPYRITQDQLPDINVPAAAQFISKCAGIPPSSVDQLDLFDFNAACWAVAGFFLNAGSSTSGS